MVLEQGTGLVVWFPVGAEVAEKAQEQERTNTYLLHWAIGQVHPVL
jgi:hypothetical protein